MCCTPAAAQPDMGINAQVFMQARPSAASENRHLDAMAADGMQVIRLDATWGRVQPRAPLDGRPRFMWANYDRWVKALASRGLRWLPVLAYSAPWATSIAGNEHAPPSPVPAFAAYAGAFAPRSGSGGTYWPSHPTVPRMPVTTYEVWNEPNLSTFWGGRSPDPGRYAELFLAAEHALGQA